jgi:large subunit ribosomal protein L21
MFAIIKVGGKQFKVVENQDLDIDLTNLQQGDSLDISEVLLLSKEGVPYINPKNCVVRCEVLQHFRGPKLVVFKNRQRSTFRKKKGHRQDYTRVKIKEIVNN